MLPFLLLLSLGLLVLLSWLLQAVGIFDFNRSGQPADPFTGDHGEVLRAVLFEGILVLLLFLTAIPAAIPLGILQRCARPSRGTTFSSLERPAKRMLHILRLPEKCSSTIQT